MKKFLVMAFAMAFAGSVYAATDFKVAYVDVQKAIEQTTMGKKAKDEMKKEAEKKNKELEKKKADIEKIREDVEKKKSVLSEEAFAKRAAEVTEEMQKFNMAAQKAQQDLQKKEAELLEPIIKKMKTVIEKVAKDQGVAMVIQSNPSAQIVLYSAAELDLTDELVKAFEKDK